MEVIACPNCGAENAIVREDCEKCSADLIVVKNILSNANKHYNTALEMAREGRHDEAIVELQAAIELWGKNPQYHNLLGTAYARKGLYDLAIKAWEATLALDSNFEKAYQSIVKARKLEHHYYEERKAQPFKIAAIGAGIIAVVLLLGLVLLGLRYGDAKTEIDRLKVEIASVETGGSSEDVQKLEKALDSYRQQLTQAERQLQQSEYEADKKVALLEQQIGQLKTDLETAKNRPTQAPVVDSTRIDELTLQIQRLEQEKEALAQQVKQERGQLSALRTRAADTEKKLEAARNNGAQLAERLKTSRSAVEVLQTREALQVQAYQLWQEQKYKNLQLVLDQMEDLEINPALVTDLRARSKEQIALQEDPLVRARMEAAQRLASQKEEEERSGYAAAKIAQAMEQVDADNLEGAQALLEEALAIHPGNEEATERLVEVNQRITEINQAIDEQYAQARSAFQQGNWDEAIEGYEQVLAARPGDKTVQAELQATREAKQVTEEASRMLRQEVERLSRLAKEASDAGQENQAMNLYRQLLELEPTNRTAQRSLERLQSAEARRKAEFADAIKNGQEQLAGQDFDRAIDAFNAALKVARLAEEKQQAQQLIDQTRQTQQRVERERLQRDQQFEASVTEAGQLYEDGLYDEALKEINRALELKPEDRGALRLRRKIASDWDKEVAGRIMQMLKQAEELEADGKTDEALQIYRQVLQLNPNNETARARVDALGE